MSTKRFIAKSGAVLAAAGLITLTTAGIASAHVTAKVLGEPAVQGGYTKITFRVPNEDNTAGTVKPAAAGQPEPEHPAPALAVQAKNGKSDDHGATAQTSTSDSHEHAEASAQDDTARWLGGGGLAVGALGLGIGVGATLRARRNSAASGSEQA